jgi:hypothetical protein
MRELVTLVLLVLSCSASVNPLEFRLERELRLWQKRLSMDDWSLSIQVVRQHDLDKNTWGGAEWDPDKKTGVIRVLDPLDYNLKGGELKLDMECTIVHELVHIQVAPLDAKTERQREQIVNRLMTALINRPCPN